MYGPPNLINIIFCWSLSLIAIVSTTLALIFCAVPTEAMICLIIVTAAFCFVSIVLTLKEFRKKHDFVSYHGIYVWTDKIEAINPVTIGIAAEMFIDRLIAKNIDKRITKESLNKMLAGSKLIFKRGPITWMGLGWLVKDKAGLQKGNEVMVQYCGSIESSALDHEWLHMVDELILHNSSDYDHVGILFK